MNNHLAAETLSTMTPAERASVIGRFYQVITHCDIEPTQDQYDRVKLVRFNYEYSSNQISQDNFLHAFFEFLKLPISNHVDFGNTDELGTRLYEFADYLIDNFFLPLKASMRKTPQPTPEFHSAIMKTQRQDHAFSEMERLACLRGACLLRDRYRCVISPKFDKTEALKHFQKHGNDTIDQNGMSLVDPGKRFDYLEVAHILPHSLTRLNSSGELSSTKAAALAILNMFDSGVAHLIEGVNIDRPSNAITLTLSHHVSFGDFRVYFEPVGETHTYRIDTFLPAGLVEDLPVTRTLFLTEDRSIDPPSVRLLAVHRAIAHILHLSAAGDYIDHLLRDVDEFGIRADGSTDLSRLLKLRLGDASGKGHVA